jgi:serine protease Do
MTVRLTVQRLNEARPKPMRAPPAKPKQKMSQLGLSLSPLDNDSRAEYRVPGGVQGVVVTDVTPDSPADEKNVRAGDVIVAVQNQPVRTPDDITRRVEADLRAGRKVEVLLVSRAGALTYVALRF